jgi:AraC-like DNA-binding protein
VLRTLCGRDWDPIEVHFAHYQPRDVRPFRQFFRAPLRFDAAQNAIVFSGHWLKLRLPEFDPELDRLLRRHIDALDARVGDDLPDQIRAVLRTVLMTDDAGIEQVAALFSMHARTLSRRLHSFGTSFRALADEGRSEVARKMLQNTALDVSHIASLLGYADASAFTRAFRRWTDTTPAAWRKRQAGQY